MPEKTTFRDVAPILERLVMDVKFPILSKSDLVFRKMIAENIDRLSEFDFDEVAINTHTLGEVGNILANNIREKSAELASAIQKFWHIFKEMERNRKTRHEDIDFYESKYVLDEVDAVKREILFYKRSLTAAGIIPGIEEMEIDEESRLYRCSLLPTYRDQWYKAKKKLIEKLQHSIEMDDFFASGRHPDYNVLKHTCAKIFKAAERYFPPCEITMPENLIETFETHFAEPGGSEAIKRISRYKRQKETAENGDSAVESKSEVSVSEPIERKTWDDTMFSMELTCKLHKLCKDMFEDMTEESFHSSLNMDGQYAPLQVIKGHTIKLCYMLSRLYDLVPKDKKQEWRDDVLVYLNISPDYYHKKYRQPRGSDASEEGKAFADEVDKIIKNHKKSA